jgi:hypothetical protein
MLKINIQNILKILARPVKFFEEEERSEFYQDLPNLSI